MGARELLNFEQCGKIRPYLSQAEDSGVVKSYLLFAVNVSCIVILFCFSGSVPCDHRAHSAVSVHGLPLPQMDALGSHRLRDQLHISLS